MSFLFLAALALTQQVADTITVTATRTETRLTDTPSSVVVISKETLAATAALTVDDALRQVPGFTLFRRSGSRVANPTAQGVSLRGIGASGASRALVLDDGIPLNDAFGGWVYWGRVPRAAIDRIEVVRGGASDLYGSTAMGGVLQFIRLRQQALVAETSAGSEETASMSLFGATTHDAWNASLAADLFTTAGYVLVQPSQRGAVDRRADSRHTTFDGTLRRDRAFFRASYFRERRNNGTPLQENDTLLRQLAGGIDTDVAAGALTVRAYGNDQNYRQTFSAVAANRASERLTVDQRVPSRSAGGSAQWARAIGAKNAIVSGVEFRRVSGTSHENSAVSGGNQSTTGAFLEDVAAITKALSMTAGVRLDRWRDSDAWSPRLSLLWRVDEKIALTASAYRAFRAPTLNELYRGFRVGNIITLANKNLGPERVQTFEAGARVANVRVTFFQASVDDTIANVTLSTTPALITRQRRNLGASRSRGAEIEGDWQLGARWRASAGGLFVDATVTDGDLRGRRLPQVPRSSVTAQMIYTSRATIGLQTRWSASQFDDDRNDLPLRSYAVADVFASHPLAAGLSLTMAVENAFDRRIEASATPVITLGQPRTFRLGLRYARNGLAN